MSATDWQDVSKPKRAPTSRNKPYRVETTSDGRRSYHCDVCRVKSGSRIDIEQHIRGRRHHENLQELQGRAHPQVSLQREEPVLRTSRWYCHLCSQSFKSAEEQSHHNISVGHATKAYRIMQTTTEAGRVLPDHTLQKWFSCLTCGLPIKNLPSLKEHLKGKRHAANQLAIRRQDFERATPSQATLTSDGPAEVAEDLRNGTDEDWPSLPLGNRHPHHPQNSSWQTVNMSHESSIFLPKTKEDLQRTGADSIASRNSPVGTLKVERPRAPGLLPVSSRKKGAFPVAGVEEVPENYDFLEELIGGLNGLSASDDTDLIPVASQFLICPLSKIKMTDPVCASDGHTYQKECIEEWLSSHDTSPVDGKHMPDKKLMPNLLVKQMLDGT